MAKSETKQAEVQTNEIKTPSQGTILDDLVWHTGTKRIKDLKDHEKNPRKITKDQMEKLKQLLKSFNYVETIVVNLDNTILTGHMRVKAMKALGRGKEEIEVRAPNRQLTSREAEEYLIRSNKNSGEYAMCNFFKRLLGLRIESRTYRFADLKRQQLYGLKACEIDGRLNAKYLWPICVLY